MSAGLGCIYYFISCFQVIWWQLNNKNNVYSKIQIIIFSCTSTQSFYFGFQASQDMSIYYRDLIKKLLVADRTRRLGSMRVSLGGYRFHLWTLPLFHTPISNTRSRAIVGSRSRVCWVGMKQWQSVLTWKRAMSCVERHICRSTHDIDFFQV